MADLPISSATTLTHSTIASGDLFPVLDISAASGSKGSKITLTELTTAVNATLLGQANTFTLGQTINAGTVKVSTPILAGTQTWNDGAVAFTALDVNVTDNASAAASLLMNLRVGGTSKFSVTKAGAISAAGINLNFADLTFGNTANFYSAVYSGGTFANLYGYGALFLNNGQTVLTSNGNLLNFGTDSATPATQTVGGQRGLGTNITGGVLNIGTPGTGTGVAGVINLQSHAAGSTGTALGTLVNVLSIISPGVVRITGIPTSSAGLSSGDIYSNAGVLTIVP